MPVLPVILISVCGPLHDRVAIAKLSKSLFDRIFFDEPVSTSSENALADRSGFSPRPHPEVPAIEDRD
ncbi:hypothetical protein [Methylobacterium sp. SyP6R]|uniref:hypothetical protein n=1 Tax=Methylobacterium sp. SyP6R TaxID=2718876 RepID=UPI001F35C5BE|nr:hypothetical protein [Methylobacterium sp. SyP6R]MCF4124396.1 hypothetical protein [Methylobacterium sp. SyP6R]